MVVQSFAECLPKLADTALRFLETSQFFRQKSHHHHHGALSNSGGSSPSSLGSSSGESPGGASMPKNASSGSLSLSGSSVSMPTSSASISSTPHSVFQREIEEIRNAFKDVFILMLRDDAPGSVKKAILSNVRRSCFAPIFLWSLLHLALAQISSLCVFFGKDQTNDVLLPLIFSCLNSRDWELKCIVFENVVGVSAVAGPDHIESWILTCIPRMYSSTDQRSYHF